MTGKRFLLLLVLALIPSSLLSNTLYFPQVVFGGGYSTTFVIVNTGTTAVSSFVQFFNQGGRAAQIQAQAAQVRATVDAITSAIQADPTLSAAQRTSLVVQLFNLGIQAATAAPQAVTLQQQISALEVQLVRSGLGTSTQLQQLASLRLQLEDLLRSFNVLVPTLNIALNFAAQSGVSNLPSPVSLLPYTLPINIPAGGSTRVTLPNSGSLTVGWGQLVASSGNVEGVANLEFRGVNNGLIAASGVSGIDAGDSFVIPVDVTPSASVGIAIANIKNDNPVNVSLSLFREDGSAMGTASDDRLNPLGSGLQLADLVTNWFPQLAGTTFKGTLVVEPAPGTAPNSITATALNVRDDGLSALPVVLRGAGGGSTAGNTLYFPQVVVGGGYSSSFIIMNTGATNVSSRVNFYDQKGGNRVAYSTAINMPAGGSTRLTLPNTGPLTVLWGELAAGPGTVRGMATFDFRADSGRLIATAGIPGVEAANSFRLPVDVTAITGTGIAIANVKDVPVSVGLRLLKEDGTLVASANDARLSPLGPRQQVADLVSSIFPQLSGTFKGTLVVDAAAGVRANSLVAAAVTVKPIGSPSEFSPPELTALPRDLTTAERKLINAADAFSLALWAKTNAALRGENVFISPLSASFALGMTLNGAGSRNLDEMRRALQLGGATEQEINEGYQSLIALLGGIDPAVKMQIANSIWYRNTFPFRQSFLDINKQYFDAEVRGMNFADVDGTLETVNGWVDAKTNHKIPTILGRDDITPTSVMFLINTIYFNGGWREKFDPAQTRAALFRAAGGSTQSMSLMHRQSKMSYAETAEYQAVDLPYGNSAFTMTVVLPKEGTDIDAFAASLTPTAWQSLTRGLQSVDVDLSLPKLKLNYERKLNADLQALGMITAFDEVNGADDFLRMSPRGRDLYISFVRQKTFVDINEEGTEAAAVTAVGVSVVVCACPPPPIKMMRVDRPYIFVIRERLSGTILFMGKIVKMP